MSLKTQLVRLLLVLSLAATAGCSAAGSQASAPIAENAPKSTYSSKPTSIETVACADNGTGYCASAEAIRQKIEAYLANQSCEAGVALYRQGQGGIEQVLAIDQDRPLDPMSLFKSQLAGFYYTVSGPQDWEKDKGTIFDMLQYSKNEAAAQIFKRITEITGTDNVIRDFNSFLSENGLTETGIQQWDVKIEGWTTPKWGEPNACFPGDAGIECNKVSSARDQALYLMRLYEGKITYNGKAMTKPGLDAMLDILRVHRNPRLQLSATMPAGDTAYGKEGLFSPGLGDSYPSVYTEGVLIVNPGGVPGAYAGSILIQGCRNSADNDKEIAKAAAGYIGSLLKP